MKRVALGAVLLLAACSQPSDQQAAEIKAALDGGACLLTVAPPVIAVAQSTGATDTQKAVAAATVAYQAGASSSGCPQLASDVATAIAAGKVAVPAAVK